MGGEMNSPFLSFSPSSPLLHTPYSLLLTSPLTSYFLMIYPTDSQYSSNSR